MAVTQVEWKQEPGITQLETVIFLMDQKAGEIDLKLCLCYYYLFYLYSLYNNDDNDDDDDNFYRFLFFCLFCI